MEFNGYISRLPLSRHRGNFELREGTMTESIQLAKFIEDLRAELSDAIAQGAQAKYRFRAKEIEVELQVGVESTNEGSGKLSFKVFGIGAEGGGGLTRGSSGLQTVKLSLELLDAEGRPPLIKARSSETDR
jgi:hypothetical protein